MHRLLLLLSWLVVVSTEVLAAQGTASVARLVEAVEPSNREDIQFIDFRFQQLRLYELSVHYGPIDDAQPTIGARYGVEAILGGQEQIASLMFAMIDESGKPLARLRIDVQATGSSGYYEFVGFMTVPDHPFRIAVTGERTNGQAFVRVFPRLFRPVSTPPRGPIPPGLPPDMAEMFQKMLDDQAPRVVAERQALLSTNPTGKLVMPRTHVQNVMYEPLLSGSTQPIGLRVTYDVTFSEAGRYNPRLRVFAEDPSDSAVGRNPLNVRLSMLTPAPRLTHAPIEYAETFRVLMSQESDFLYEANTVYTFTVELVPNFFTLERGGVTPCLSMQRFRNMRDPQAAFERLKTGEGPATYRVFIGHNAFEGRIEGFYGEGAMYRTFVADQIKPCDERQ